jgi:hypothetical protein
MWTMHLTSGEVVLILSPGNEEHELCSKGKLCEGYSEAHIVYSMVYWGYNRGALDIDSTVQNTHYLLSY